MQKPAVSIIVCHHKGDFIYEFVRSVRKSKFKDYEIIIVSSDVSLMTKVELIFGDSFVYYHDGMPAAKRNHGAKIAKGQYLAFFDDDVEIGFECLYYLHSCLEGYEPGMAYGKLYKADEPNRFDEAGGYLTSTGFIWSRAGQNIIDVGQYTTYDPILAGKSASCIINKSLFESVGGFDEDFEILGEETDLSWRVWLSGAKVRFCPWAIGYHYFNTKWKPAKDYYTSKRVHYNGCRNYITMLIKNLETKNLWKILPLHVLIWFFAGCAMIGTLKIDQGMNIFGGLWYVIRNLQHVLMKRSIVQKRRVISDKELWPSIFRKAPRGYYLGRLRRYIAIGLHG